MLRRLAPLAAVAALLPAAAAAQPPHAAAGPPACEWPMFGHDASRDFSSDCAAAPRPDTVGRLHPRWVVHTSDVVTASPAVSGGTVYAGAWDGTFYALDLAGGALRWQAALGNAAPAPWTDQHRDDYGEITSSAAVADVLGQRRVFVGAGGSLYSLDAATGTPQWRFDVDPAHPTGLGEIESSPVVWQGAPGPHPWVIVGADANQSSGFPGEGVWAVDAVTGTAVWHFSPETWTGRPLYGCGNVWSSPALDLDPANPDPARRAMLFFGMADCPDNTPSGSLASLGPISLPGVPGQAPAPRPCPSDGSDPNCPAGSSYDYSQRWQPYAEAIVGLDALTGTPVWSYQPHAADNTADDDFGSSAQVFSLPGGRRVVGEANKDGWYYAVDRDSGALLWKALEQGNGNVQPGQAIGGFIGNTAVGGAPGHPGIFGGSAIDTPVTYDPATGAPAPQSDPAAGLTPMRGFSAADGSPRWQAVQGPTYGASTVARGVVYNGALDGLLRAYDTASGSLLWAFPLGGPISSGAAVAGSDVVVGAGTSDTDLEFKACDPFSGPLGDLCHQAPLDPQLNPLSKLGSIWAFTTDPGLPSVPASAVQGSRGTSGPAAAVGSAPRVGGGSSAGGATAPSAVRAQAVAARSTSAAVPLVAGGAATLLAAAVAKRRTRRRRARS